MERKEESERDISLEIFRTWRNSLHRRETHRNYDTLAINYSRIMSGRALFAPRKRGRGKRIIACRLLFSLACVFHLRPPPLFGRGRSTQILGGETRFYAEICGFIGNSYEGQSARAQARKLNELRTIHGIWDPRRAVIAIYPHRAYAVHRCTPPARIIKRVWWPCHFLNAAGLAIISTFNDAMIVNIQ